MVGSDGFGDPMRTIRPQWRWLTVIHAHGRSTLDVPLGLTVGQFLSSVAALAQIPLERVQIQLVTIAGQLSLFPMDLDPTQQLAYTHSVPGFRYESGHWDSATGFRDSARVIRAVVTDIATAGESDTASRESSEDQLQPCPPHCIETCTGALQLMIIQRSRRQPTIRLVSHGWRQMVDVNVLHHIRAKRSCLPCLARAGTIFAQYTLACYGLQSLQLEALVREICTSEPPGMVELSFLSMHHTKLNEQISRAICALPSLTKLQVMGGARPGCPWAADLGPSIKVRQPDRRVFMSPKLTAVLCPTKSHGQAVCRFWIFRGTTSVPKEASRYRKGSIATQHL